MAWVASVKSVKQVNRMVVPASVALKQVNIPGQESPAECLLAVVGDSHVKDYLSEEPGYLE
jgi:hypothetical protein